MAKICNQDIYKTRIILLLLFANKNSYDDLSCKGVTKIAEENKT